MAGKQQQEKKKQNKQTSEKTAFIIQPKKELKSQLALVTKGKKFHEYTLSEFKKKCINQEKHKTDYHKNMQ